MPFDNLTGHLLVTNPNSAHVKCEYCLGSWSYADFARNDVPRCKGTMQGPGPCPNCENDSGWTRHLGREGEEVVEACPNHRPDPKRCSCATLYEHLENCPEFWPGGLRRS
jgi:hypothetical protein